MAYPTNHNRKPQRLLYLAASLLLAQTLLTTPTTDAFTSPIAKNTAASFQSPQQQHVWNTLSQESSPTRLHLFRDNDNEDNNKRHTDWHKVAETSGRIARKVGDQVLRGLEVGSSKLVDLVSQGTEKVKSAFQEGFSGNTDTNNNRVVVDDDTHDADLFRGIFTEERTQVRSPYGRVRSTYRTTTIFEEEEDNEAVRDAFIRNQFMANNVHGSDDDYVVNAMLNDGYATVEEFDDGGIEVEVMEGIRRPTSASRNRVVDVEILDKTFMR